MHRVGEYGIFEQMRGHIDIEREPGAGTTITIWFPHHDAHESMAQGEESSSDVPRGSETVRVVEDEPLVRMSACHYLEDLGDFGVEARVQDGHGMLPMLAHPKRAFLAVTGVNLAAGLLVGAVAAFLGY